MGDGSAARAPLVTEPDQLGALLERAGRCERYALDTEFHREKTYHPRLALVQLAWADEVVLLDPLAIDLAPLADLLVGPATAVLHAADQDLEVLQHHCGAIPSVLFDTQIAAGFVGYGTPSLTALVDGELGIHLPKGDRLTDWLARPLDDRQLTYAASDVAHLLPLAEQLERQLAALGRLGWAEDECEAARVRPRGPREPQEAWRRIKEARQLRGTALSVARAVAAWREERAAASDIPARFVLPDLAVVGIAQRRPRDLEALRAVRGVDGRHLRGETGRALLDAVDLGCNGPRPDPVAREHELPKHLKAAVGLVSAWLSQLSRELTLDPTLLATRADLEGFLAGDPTSRLAHGWRHEIAGEPIRRLLAGEAAVAFEDGRLVLEPRGGAPS